MICRSVLTSPAAILILALTACGGSAPRAEEPDTIEAHCAEVTEQFSGDLFYDENMAVLPDRLAVLERLRLEADGLETAGGDPAPDEWLTGLDGLIEALDNVANFQGGPGTDMLLFMNVDVHETQVEQLGAIADDVGLGEECSDISAWKFFPDIPA